MVVQEGDIITVVYNKEGLASTITGRVTQIGNGDYTTISSVPKFYGSSGVATYDTVLSKKPNVGDYMIVDGSGEYTGNLVVIYLATILDCTLLNKYEDNASILSPKSDCCGNQQITGIRVHKGKVQYTTDYGLNWTTMSCECNTDDSSEGDGDNCPCND
jgi:hypothetical protein